MEARGTASRSSPTISACAGRTQRADRPRSQPHRPTEARSFHAGDHRFESGWGYPSTKVPGKSIPLGPRTRRSSRRRSPEIRRRPRHRRPECHSAASSAACGRRCQGTRPASAPARHPCDAKVMTGSKPASQQEQSSALGAALLKSGERPQALLGLLLRFLDVQGRRVLDERHARPGCGEADRVAAVRGAARLQRELSLHRHSTAE